jgi:hypothetical protein
MVAVPKTSFPFSYRQSMASSYTFNDHDLSLILTVHLLTTLTFLVSSNYKHVSLGISAANYN